MAKGISLHLGLNKVDPNHYAGWSGPLNACEADAHSMEQLAKSQGFDTATKLSSAATRSVLIEFLNFVAKNLQKGDIFLLTYSGHGGQVPDQNGDEEDGLDETWCLYDGQLIDDELYYAFSKIKPGVRGLVLSDSCHSGTVIKDVLYQFANSAQPALKIQAPLFRNMPAEVGLRTYEQNRQFYDKIVSELPKDTDFEKGDIIKATVRLISGCQDNQLSSDGTFNGAFTAALLRVWNGGKFNGNYGEFHRAVLSKMPPSQSPNQMIVGVADKAFDNQKPFTV